MERYALEEVVALYKPYTEYIDALGSSQQKRGETGRERRLRRAPGLAGVLPGNIRTVSVWGGGGARRVSYLSLTSSPFFCASRMLTLLSYLVRVRAGVRVRVRARPTLLSYLNVQCGAR